MSVFKISSPPSSKPATEVKYADLPPEDKVAFLAEKRAQLISEFRLEPKPVSFTGGLTGLENLGNTCYMSSILQCLLACNPLTSYLVTQAWQNELNVATAPNQGRLAAEYYTLVCKVWCQSNFKLVPTSLKLQMSSRAKLFSGSDQQDAHEFLTFFLDYLSEDLNKVILKPYIQIKEQDDQNLGAYADYCFSVHKQRNSSFITDTFDGQTCFLSECPECLFKSITCEPFEVLSLPIPAPETTRVSGYVHTLSGEYPIQEFVFGFDNSYDLNKIRSFVFRKAFQGNPDEFLPLWISGNRIEERIGYPYRLTPAEIAERPKSFLFFSQVYDPIIMKSVFKDKVREIEAQLKSKIEYRINLTAFQGSNQISVEKEIVSPDCVTAFEAYLLVYSIFRENFAKSGIRDVDRLSAVFPATHEALTSEFLGIFGGKETPPLFVLRANGTSFPFTNKTANLFEYFFEKSMKLEVTVDPTRFLAPLQLKKCYNVSSKTVEVADPRFTLYQCFDWMIKSERLDEGNQWTCRKCQKATKARKKAALRKLPKVLVIHLNRFSTEFRGNEPIIKKNNSLIDFPLEGLDLNNYTLPGTGEPTYYNLFAVSSHFGTAQKGHYKAYCWETLKKSWVCCDDTSVTKAEPREIVTPQAYLLFYEKVGRK
jgi:ubiquitin carboxyl-terminal hydrolase 4/11/15